MTEKEFLQEIATATVDRKNFVEELRAYEMPVFMFGAGEFARETTNMLNECNLEVDGYLVDDKYYKPNSIYLNRPVYSFSEISANKSQSYVLIRGINPGWREARNRIEKFPQFKIYEFIKENFYTLTYEDIVNEKEKFFETYNLLTDELSKKTFLICLKAHISLVPCHLKDIVATKEYFNELTESKKMGGGTFVDCGAFRGDTVKKFIDFVGGKYKKIFAVEPDEKNFAELQKFVKDNEYKNIFLYQGGVYDKKGTVNFMNYSFMGYSSTGSKVSEDGEWVVNVDTIDNIVGDSPVSLIKMDIEGSELPALKGAINTLKKSRPVLVISVYHRQEDLITIPQFIKDVYKNCRFYLRQYRTVDVADLDLYVIPE